MNVKKTAFGPDCSLGREKSTVEEIRSGFDNDIERFSHLETGQQAAVDAVLVLEIVAKAIATRLQPGNTLLDLGCGAGNYTLRILKEVKPLQSHLVDLSQKMLERAQERIKAAGNPSVTVHQSDLRELKFEPETADCIVAGAVLHHLREESDWLNAFGQFHRWLKPGGRLFVADIAVYDDEKLQELVWKRYGAYLDSVAGTDYRKKTFAHIEKEDTPRSIPFQFEMLRRAGFSNWDVLHRNSITSCYFATK